MKQKIKKLQQKLGRKSGLASLCSGSILAYSLIILAIMLATALSIAAVTVLERKSSGTTAKSNQAFAVADSGTEIALQQVAKNPNSPVSSLGTCTGSTVTISVANGTADLTFYSDENATTPIACGGNLGDARKVKSVGKYAGTTRAVEVAVAQTYTPVGTCYDEDDQLFIWFRNNNCGRWSQCTESQITTAMAKGCMPIIGQYGGVYLAGCFPSTGGPLPTIKLLAVATTPYIVWNIQDYRAGDFGGRSCSTVNPLACCKLGP